MFKNFTANHGKATIHDEDVMNENAEKLFKSFGLNDEQIASIGQKGVETMEDLPFLEEKDLTEIGMLPIKARRLLEQVKPAETPQPVASPDNSDKFTAALEQLIAKDRDCCPNCKESLPKGFNEEICPHCGLPVNEQVKCLSCGKTNNGGNNFCTGCSGRILSGEAYRQVKYLLDKEGVPFRQAVLMLGQIKQDEAEFRRFQRQVEKWINDGGLAQSQSVTRGGGQGPVADRGFHIGLNFKRD